MNPEVLGEPSSSIQKLHRRSISLGMEGPGIGIQQAFARPGLQEHVAGCVVKQRQTINIQCLNTPMKQGKGMRLLLRSLDSKLMKHGEDWGDPEQCQVVQTGRKASENKITTELKDKLVGQPLQ